MADPTVRNLAGSLIAAAAGLAVLAATVWLASDWLAERERAFNRARGDLARAANQYRNASDNQAVYRQYADRFRDMSERGWIGEEGRLTWIEALQSINADLKLPTLRYEIGQRTGVAHDRASGSSRLHLYRTPMRLEIGALHEYDVVELLERLDQRGDGLLSLSGCTMTRNGNLRFDARSANVNAACELNWYTLRLDTDEE
ncbi:hypothetical protein [Halofilum ochraceum]|uniref:hypothetical protein n=1 Tax=Halofilum ochraceum TaxID=1611323 RepID=UPI0011131B0B|nr:hypothetical protein [Halofilum ochraceum]